MINGSEHTALVTGLKTGDDRALNQLFDQYYTALCYFAEGITHNREEAKDIVVTSFNKLWERREKFDNPSGIKSFLYIVTRNACFDFLKQRQRSTNYHDEFISEVSTHEDDAERLLTESELLRKIYQEAANLPTKCREVFELTYFEGLNTAQIAERLNTTVTNVTSQRSRAIQLLKLALTDKELVLFYLLLASLYCKN